MQQPDGTLQKFLDEETAKLASAAREMATGKPHPVFTVGEILKIKGAPWRVTGIAKKRLYLKAMPY